MSDFEIYVKLLQHLDGVPRIKLQDVLCELRGRVAKELNISEMKAQMDCEEAARTSR